MLAEMFFKNYHVPVVSLRPFLPYGPFETNYRLIPQVINGILQGSDIPLAKGEEARDFIFIEDVVRAFLLAAVTPDIAGETFNISTGKATPVKDVVQMVIDLMNASSSARPVFGALPYRPFESGALSGSPAKAKRKLGWTAPVSLEEGLKQTIEWFRANKERFPHYRPAVAAKRRPGQSTPGASNDSVINRANRSSMANKKINEPK
jgi:nucleoside-diphosphate-sugar epimerase